MQQRSFAGAHTALVTPLLPDGSVDWEGFRKNLAFQLDQGVTGLVPAGTTGECPTMDWDEQGQVIETAIRVAAGRCLVIAGTGSNSTREALAASRRAADAGADALLLVDCYYNGPSSLELRLEYHGAIAAACPDVAVIPYIIPARTGTALSPEDLALLAAEHPNACAVKEATGDVERMARTRALVGDHFDILSGDDNLTCQIMLDPRIRAQGVVSVMSNVIPAAVVELVNAARRGDTAGADHLNVALAPLFDIVTVFAPDERILPAAGRQTVKDKFRNPLPIKTLMTGLGLPAGPLRPPLGKMTRAGVEKVRAAVRTVWRDSPWVLEPLAEAYDINVAWRIDDDNCWRDLAYT